MNKLLKDVIRLRRQERYDESREILDSLLSDDPHNPEYLAQYAFALDNQGQEEAAIGYYRKALEHNPKKDLYTQISLGLGSSLRAIGRYEEAVEVLEEGVSKDPRHAALQTFYALSLYNVGRYQESVRILAGLLVRTSSDRQVKAFKEALEIYADDPDKVWKSS